jgi:hypothetical protein
MDETTLTRKLDPVNSNPYVAPEKTTECYSQRDFKVATFFAVISCVTAPTMTNRSKAGSIVITIYH